MIDEELMNKFDRIQDLPVSEEMLGAYLEGNLSEEEVSDIELMLQYQPYLSEISEEVSQLYVSDSNFCDNTELIIPHLADSLNVSWDMSDGIHEPSFSLIWNFLILVQRF